MNSGDVDNLFAAEKIDVVILAAAKVGGVWANNTYPAEFIYNNLQIQNNVIWAAHIHNFHCLIFLGSSCIYPRECNQPIKEEYKLTGALEYNNQPYAIAKIAGIELVNSLRKQFKRDYFCVMPTNLFGEQDNYHPENSHVIASLIRKFCEAKKNDDSEVIVWGDASSLREFMHSEELADAALFLSSKISYHDFEESDLGKNNISHINADSGFEISIKNLDYLIASIVDFRGDIVFDATKPNGTLRKIMYNSIIKKFGWNSSNNFKGMLTKTILRFKKDMK
jgi:GDP-L-fucose synthase